MSTPNENSRSFSERAERAAEIISRMQPMTESEEEVAPTNRGVKKGFYEQAKVASELVKQFPAMECDDEQG